MLFSPLGLHPSLLPMYLFTRPCWLSGYHCRISSMSSLSRHSSFSLVWGLFADSAFGLFVPRVAVLLPIPFAELGEAGALSLMWPPVPGSRELLGTWLGGGVRFMSSSLLATHSWVGRLCGSCAHRSAFSGSPSRPFLGGAVLRCPVFGFGVVCRCCASLAFRRFWFWAGFPFCRAAYDFLTESMGWLDPTSTIDHPKQPRSCDQRFRKNNYFKFSSLNR